jgi:predicted permease
VVIILAVLVLAIFGVVRLGRTLEPKQRVVLVIAFICAIAYVLFQLAQLGYLGQRTDN